MAYGGPPTMERIGSTRRVPTVIDAAFTLFGSGQRPIHLWKPLIRQRAKYVKSVVLLPTRHFKRW